MKTVASVAPGFWRNNSEAINNAVASVSSGRSSAFAKSAGGRDIYIVEYGKKQDFGRTANYISACAYKDLSAYAKKSAETKPVVLIIGAVHGGEVEGIASLLNLLSVFESGADLRGRERAVLRESAMGCRVLIIPCMNPDGRARVPFQVVSEVSEYDVVYYKHGRWKGGGLADFDAGFRVHPIHGAVEYMGGYYNDDGVNLCADRLTCPTSPENRALIELVDREAPDVAVFLHTGCHVHGKLIEPGYLPGFMHDEVMEFDRRLDNRFTDSGYNFYTLDKHGAVGVDRMPRPPRQFDLPSAVHHTCGGLSFEYESYEASWDSGDPYSCENILDCHFLLFEEIFATASAIKNKFNTEVIK